MTAFEVVIRLGRPFDVQVRNGRGEQRYASFGESTAEITIPFADRQSAEAAQREISVSVRRVHDAGGEDYRPVVAGRVLPDEEEMRARRRARLEYTDAHGGWMSDAARDELNALRAAEAASGGA